MQYDAHVIAYHLETHCGNPMVLIRINGEVEKHEFVLEDNYQRNVYDPRFGYLYVGMDGDKVDLTETHDFRI